MRLYDVTTGVSGKRGATSTAPRIMPDEPPKPTVRYHEDEIVNEIITITIEKDPGEWWLLVRNLIRESPEAAITAMKLYSKRYPGKTQGLIEHFNFLVEREVIDYPKLTFEEIQNAAAAEGDRATH